MRSDNICPSKKYSIDKFNTLRLQDAKDISLGASIYLAPSIHGFAKTITTSFFYLLQKFKP